MARSFVNGVDIARLRPATKSRFFAPLRFAQNDSHLEMSSRAQRGICFSSRHAKNLPLSAAEAPLGGRRRLGDAKGFTLLELLIGITLMAMLMAALLVGLRLANRAWQQGEARLREGHAEQERRAFLAEQISSLRPYVVNSTDPKLPGSFQVLQATASVLRFVTTYGSRLRSRSGLTLAEYAVVPTSRGTTIVLRESPIREDGVVLRRLVERVTQDPETGETMIRYRPFAARESDLALMTGLQRASFEYLDLYPKGAGGPRWLAQWKSRPENPYPAAIRLRWEQRGRQEEMMIRLRAQALPQP